MTRAPAARAAAFKQCCLKAGRYDGVQRDDYFSRVNRRPKARPGVA
jgi:hypothetical protein